MLDLTDDVTVIFARRMERKVKKTADADIIEVTNFWKESTPEMNNCGKKGFKHKRLKHKTWIRHKKHVYRGSVAELYGAYA